ncbi:hypothetical protein H0H92_014140 [Tricholoma furcatifolium]|nr:hypothetical protein H0H92_014140 [Tricholoma furcatifolium]
MFLLEHYSFDQLRVDVPNFNSTPEVRPYVAGTPLNPPSAVLLTYPILLTPKKRHSYFMPHESFNLMAMLSNPMMLMMVAAGAMMLATPYLMKNMDPQTLEDFKEQHAKVTGFQNAVANGDLQTGLSTLTGGEQSKKGASVTSSASSSVKNRGTKNKKR